MHPYTAPVGAGGLFRLIHLGRPFPVVGKGINPCHALAQHFTLGPGSIGSNQMGKQPAVPVHARPAVIQPDGLAEGYGFQCRLGFLGERPLP